MRTNIEFNRKNRRHAVTIVSGGASEGKSTTIFNIAYTFAKGGYSALIVDADLKGLPSTAFLVSATMSA